MADHVRYLTGDCEGMRVERVGMETTLYSKEGEWLAKYVATALEDAMADVGSLADAAYRAAAKERTP